MFYLKVDLDTLIRRIVPRGFDYWESGMDLRLGDDLFDSFVAYQSKILKQFDAMIDEYDFHVINAARPIAEVYADLQQQIQPLLPKG